MKKAMIVTLACVNVAMVAALMFVSEVAPANAQAVLGTSDYLMVTGKIDHNTEALYMIDLASRRMAGFVVDKTTKKLTPFGARRLVMDFEQRFPDR